MTPLGSVAHLHRVINFNFKNALLQKINIVSTMTADELQSCHTPFNFILNADKIFFKQTHDCGCFYFPYLIQLITNQY